MAEGTTVNEGFRETTVAIRPATSTRRVKGTSSPHDCAAPAATAKLPAVIVPGHSLDAETLRRHAWEVSSRRAHSAYTSTENAIDLCVVSPGAAFVVWRIHSGWVEATAAQKREQWNGARPTVRLYDVSFLDFNGFNAHRLRDYTLDRLQGERLLVTSLAGTTQIAEVGFLLHTGEFLPAARSLPMAFPSTTVSSNHDYAALYVDERLVPEPLASPWEGQRFLRDRSKPRLRKDLRIAMLTFEAEAAGHQGPVATFVGALGTELSAQGLEVHAFLPAGGSLDTDREVGGVAYHPLDLGDAPSPVDSAWAFARSLEGRLHSLPPFDYFHIQEWMTGLIPWLGTRPATLALTSIERTRRNGTSPSELSRQIEKLEHEAARAAECVIVPEWLRERALAELGTDISRVHAFPMDGRPVDEWEAPLEVSRVKADFGLAASDRVLLFVGPLQWAAGPDLLVEAMTTVVARTGNARLLLVGCGELHGHLARRAAQVGIGHAVRLLGHLDLPHLIPLLRASEALLLPSRSRVGNDEAVVGLARRAGRAVLTTHSGPARLVHHEENGLLVYDNPPSLVWGMSRLLEDRQHTEAMGRNGWQAGEVASWRTVARGYTDLCAATFPELCEPAHPSERAAEGRLA